MKTSNSKISVTQTGEKMDLYFPQDPGLNTLPVDNNKFNRYRKKYCYATLQNDVSIGDSTDTVINFDLFQTNDDRYSKTNGRIIVWFPGDYIIQATVAYDANATGYRGMKVLRNGADTFENPTQTFDNYIEGFTGPTHNIVTLTCITYIGPSDYIQLQTYQNSGGGLDILAQYTTLRIYGIQ